MCGIAFTYDPAAPTDDSISRMQSCLTTMQHRGPDDTNVWHKDAAVCGHLRLAIIDLSASKQPMLSPDGRYVLVFNGEIYNYKSLAEDLRSKWNFKTSGDTEVLLAGLLLYGKEFIPRLEGMWAFALWDSQTKSLLLSRDRSGKKPLYYTTAGGAFHLASELPALRKLCVSPWAMDEDSVADYFRYGYALPGNTMYANVFEVMPATTATWTPSDGLLSEHYWKRYCGPYEGSYSDAKCELRRLLVESVEKRLVSDVEVGCFLSGGVDSSVVSAIVTKELGIRAFKAFTIGFSEEAFDERKYASLVANHIGVEHFTEVVETWDENIATSLLFGHLGQPFSDTSIIPTSLVAALARRHLKVCLSGDGSDELFCGYERYRARLIMNYYAYLPEALRRQLSRWVGRLPETYDHHSRSILKKLHLFIGAHDRQGTHSLYVAPTYFLDGEFAMCFPSLSKKGKKYSVDEEVATTNVQEMMKKDFYIYLPQDIHTKVDRASMHHSLEVRSPFMDTKIIEFAAKLPLKWCQTWAGGKKIVSDTFCDLLPNSVFSRRKQGFALPIGNWMKGGLGADLDSMLNKECGPVSVEPFKVMLSEHRNQRRDHSSKLWMVYNFLLWYQQGVSNSSGKGQ